MFVVFMAVSLAACSESTMDTAADSTPKYADADFMSDLSKALMARWDAADSENKNIDPYSDEYGDNLISLVDIELNALSKYRTATFENGKLQGAAIAYLNILEDTREAAGPLPTDGEKYMKYTEQWNNLYDQRAKAISEFADSYELTVDEAHQDTMDDFLSTAKEVTASEETEKKIADMIDALEFTASDSSGTYKTYSATMVNNTGVNFDSISLTIDLLNDEGTILEQTYAGTSELADGKNIVLEFFTDKVFSTYEIHANYYYE